MASSDVILTWQSKLGCLPQQDVLCTRLKYVEDLVTLMSWAMPCLSTNSVHLTLHLFDGPGTCYSSLAGMKGARMFSTAGGSNANVPCPHSVRPPFCSPVGGPLLPFLGECWCSHEYHRHIPMFVSLDAGDLPTNLHASYTDLLMPLCAIKQTKHILVSHTCILW